MNTSYFLKHFYTNTLIAGVFLFVFVSSLSQTFAQVNPGGAYGTYDYNTYENTYPPYSYPVYSTENYNPYNAQSMGFRVSTYEPSFSVQDNKVTATLKGDVIVPIVSERRMRTNVWFEWGETSALGQKTSSRSVNVSFTFSKTLYDLPTGKTFYYRAVAQSEYGTVYGAIVTIPAQKDTEKNTQSSSTNKPRTLVSVNTVNTEEGATAQASSGGGFFSRLFGGGATTTQAQTESKIPETSSSAQTSIVREDGLLPNTLLEWIVLSVLIFILVGFVLYMIDLYQELKKRQDEEAKRHTNGNGNANGINGGIPMRA